MNLIKRHLNLIGILILATFVGAAAGLYWDVPARIQKATRAKEIKSPADQYSCPMHPEIVSASPGKCPKCGMALTLASDPKSAHAGCGVMGETEPHGCCAKPQSAELNLPPGHPPIPRQNAHAGCAHEPETVPTAKKSSK